MAYGLKACNCHPLNTMFVKHDGYRADGAEVQFFFLVSIFNFHLNRI